MTAGEEWQGGEEWQDGEEWQGDSGGGMAGW